MNICQIKYWIICRIHNAELASANVNVQPYISDSNIEDTRLDNQHRGLIGYHDNNNQPSSGHSSNGGASITSNSSLDLNVDITMAASGQVASIKCYEASKKHSAWPRSIESGETLSPEVSFFLFKLKLICKFC